MKSRNLLLTLITIFTALTAVAQTSIGIPVQGIARDANGAARIDTPVNLTFDLYYLEGGNEVLLYTPSQVESLTTDSFGVFSAIVNTAGRRPLFGSKEIFLRILESGTVISNEQLNSVPYAIAAYNGVPTGAIMPFVGTSAQVPDGWLLCDGAAIPNEPEYDDLKNLQGPNTPNLQGMFLRGAGTNNLTSVTTVLGDVQDDSNLQHTHGNNIKVADNGGAHSHTMFLGDGGGLPSSGSVVGGDAIGNTGNGNTRDASHNHTMQGSIFNDGGNESRPVNYGVNYIIKL